MIFVIVSSLRVENVSSILFLAFSFYFYLSIHQTVYFYERRKIAFEKKRRKFYLEEKVGL